MDNKWGAQGLDTGRIAGVERIRASLPPGWTVDDEDQVIQVYDPNGMPVMQLMRPPATEQDFAALVAEITTQHQEGVADGSYLREKPPTTVEPMPGVQQPNTEPSGMTLPIHWETTVFWLIVTAAVLSSCVPDVARGIFGGVPHDDLFVPDVRLTVQGKWFFGTLIILLFGYFARISWRQERSILRILWLLLMGICVAAAVLWVLKEVVGYLFEIEFVLKPDD